MVTITQLPKEIHVSILSLLNTAEQLECIRVNHLWHQIVSNDLLYDTIVFNNNLQKLNDGNQFFAVYEELANSVRQIEIRNFYPGNAIHLMTSSPLLFPNVNKLVWIDRRHGKKQHIARTYSFYLSQNNTSKWTKLSHIKTTYSMYLLIKGGLVDPACYANLLDLDISFKDDSCLKGTSSTVKSFIEGLKNMPRLEMLKVGDVMLDFQDMELLHEYCPMLTCLSLENLYVCAQEAVSLGGKYGRCLFNGDGLQIANNSAKKLVEMSVRFYTASNSTIFRIGNTKHTIVKWLIYINCKYSHLDSLVLDASVYDGDELLPLTEIFEQRIIEIISNTTAPATFDIMQLHPLTDKLIREIDNCSCKLNGAFLQFGKQKDIQDYTRMIQKSNQMEHHIHRLLIGTTGIMSLDAITFKPFLLNVCCQITNLVELAFEANTRQRTLIDILQHLPTLQKLKFRFFEIGRADDLSSLHPVIKKTQIKELSLGVWANNRNSYPKINRVLNFSIQSCPRLTMFSFSGAIYCGPGLVKLSFADHHQLESVQVHVDGIDYYTFNRLDGIISEREKEQRWFDHVTKVKEEDNYIEQNAHLDISFNKKIEFDLKSGLD